MSSLDTSDEESSSEASTLAHQIAPARCVGVIAPDVFLSDEYALPEGAIAEKKLDDTRYLLQVRPNGSPQNYMTSRRISKITGRYVEKQEKYTHVRDHKFPEWMTETVLDGGIHLQDGLISSDVARLDNMDQIMYGVWDVLKISGRDITGLPQRSRFQCLMELSVNFPSWLHVIQGDPNPKKFFSDILSAGGEGIVLKMPDAEYGDGWYKVKREETFDIVVIGYEESTSDKYGAHGWIKNLIMGQYVEDPEGHYASRYVDDFKHIKSVVKVGDKTLRLIEVGKTSGFTEEVRKEISENRDLYLGRLFEMEAQQRLPSGKFRHPRFLRWRDDKNPWECIWI